MNRRPMLCVAACVLALCCAARAGAAPETMERRAEMLEEQCERASATGFVVPSTGGYGGNESVSGSLDRNMRANREAMRSPRRDPAERAAAQRVCDAAAATRAELALWEDRPATTHEAIWEAVVTPVSMSARITESSLPSARAADPEERLDRLFDEMRIAKRDRAVVTAYMTGIMDAFRDGAGQSELCERADELETGADVYEVTTERAARATAEKEQLLAGLWDAVSLDAAAKITAYAAKKVTKTSQPGAEYYADWTQREITNLVALLCNPAPTQP